MKHLFLDSKRLLPLAFAVGSLALYGDATPVGADNTTQGTWGGKYGGDGYLIANGQTYQPAYGSAQVTGASTFTWAGNTTDVRALQSTAGSPSRIAALYYANNFNVNISLNDNTSHPVALYMLDWDTTSRAQTVTVYDASSNAVLDTQSITGFNGGKYFTWNIKGNVRINITATGGGSAALSAVFFGVNNTVVTPGGGGGTSTTATPIGPDTLTQGSWQGVYGRDGYANADGTGQAPSYGSVNFNNAPTFTWAFRTTDVRGLQSYDAIYGPIRTAATYYGTSVNINVSTNDGNPHQVSLYFLDWDGSNPGQTVRVTDAASGSLLDTQSISTFGGGKYFSWTIKGNVKFTVTSSGYYSALVSGVFFGAGGTVSHDPPPGLSSSATWVGSDATTQGTWTGKYGSHGYLIANSAGSTPTYANAAVTKNPYNYTWVTNTSDVRALQTSPGSASRIASMYGTYKVSYFEIPITITDGNAHNISLYLLDYDGNNRPENISIVDTSSNQVLDSRDFNGYHDGLWATWNIKGNVTIRVTPIGEIYAAVAGVFFN